MENTNIAGLTAGRLLCDKDVARILCMSPQWVRAQRHKRRKGEEHTLRVDPILIGSSPRYKESEIILWRDSLPRG